MPYDLFNQVLSISDVLAPKNDDLNNFQEGFKQGQSGNFDFNKLMDEIPKVQEQILKKQEEAQKKADALNKKMERYSLIGNILNGVGALANTTNTIYQALKYGRRGAQIGTPFSELGKTLATQGLGYGEEAREYAKIADRSPTEMLTLLKLKADVANQPFENEMKQRQVSAYESLVGKKSDATSIYQDLKDAWKRANPGKEPTVEDISQLVQATNKNPNPTNMFLNNMLGGQTDDATQNTNVMPQEGEVRTLPNGATYKFMGGKWILQ